MKMLKFAFPLFLALSMLSANQSNAQIIDSFPWFKLPNSTLDRLFAFDNMNAKSTYIIPKQSRKNVISVPKASLEKLGITKVQKNVKSIKGSIIIKRDGDCYKVGCKKSACDCILLWRDANRDNKIQPRKELRCVCTKTKKACEIAGKKISCPKK